MRLFKCGSKFLIPKNEINSSKKYNELVVERKIEKNEKLVNRTPTFAVFIAETIDDIKNNKNYRWKATKKLAAELGIPIAVIDGTQCIKLEFQKVQEMVKSVKKDRRMDLIPEIIHKIENNRATTGVLLGDVRDKIFSKIEIKKILNEIMSTISTSEINIFNQGIEEFAKVTKTIKNSYLGKCDLAKECQTYDYDAYLEKLKRLFTSRNGLNADEQRYKEMDYPQKQNSSEIEF